MDHRGAFDPIIGGQNIANFMGYNYHHMCRQIIPDMKSYGLMWKNGNNLSSKLVTTPLLINIYFVIHNTKKNHERNKGAEEL
ncbi:unnamed protein product [marine sediment metagenome]|uniref:Uncharacterized protein n=1 Tax=marine sediment metagenome TaxID=412755 RepID=X0SPK1_9ZZZZ